MVVDVKAKSFGGRSAIVTGETGGGQQVAPGRQRDDVGAEVAPGPGAEARGDDTGKSLLVRLKYYLAVLESIEALVLRSATVLLLIITVVKMILIKIG